MRRQSPERINVTVITGYLGSGKTTLLRGLLAHPRLRDTAVIVNEFGEIGLDHLLVERGAEDVVLLDSGCLCCTINESLADTLGDLTFRRARGEIPAFRRVVIETSGLADPAPILHALMTDRLVTGQYALDGLVAVVDAVHGLEQLDATPEAVKQAAIADRLVVSKTDLADAGTVARLRARLAGLNPRARILAPVGGAVEKPDDLLDLRAAEGLEFDEIARIRGSGAAHAQRHGAHEGGGDHAHPAHAGVATYAFQLDRPATWAGYDFWVRRLKEFRGPDLLRMKGVLGFEGRAAPCFVQCVQHMFSAPEPMRRWPWPDRKGRLVFIARNIDRATLARSLESLHEPEGVHRPVSGEDAL